MLRGGLSMVGAYAITSSRLKVATLPSRRSCQAMMCASRSASISAAAKPKSRSTGSVWLPASSAGQDRRVADRLKRGAGEGWTASPICWKILRLRL